MAQIPRPDLQGSTANAVSGQTGFVTQIDRPESQLACEAMMVASLVAGITPSEVDGPSSFTMETTGEVTLAKNINAGDFVIDENLRWGSASLQTNTSGGGLSGASVHRFNLIAEGTS
jgi:hypothetical protein